MMYNNYYTISDAGSLLPEDTADIYEQRQFTYTGKKYSFIWEDMGIELHFPSAISDVYIETEIEVLTPFLSGNFVPPEGTTFVSAVYRITSSHPFPYPITVRIQHCVSLKNNGDAETFGMSYVIAHDGPVRKFHTLNNGVFDPESFHGEIQLTEFCYLSVTATKGIHIVSNYALFAAVFYTRSNAAKFVVMKNNNAHVHVS